MKTVSPFRSHRAFGGEILAQQATFLPVAPSAESDQGPIFTEDMQHFARFSRVFNFNRKNLTLAQPLLKEDLR